MAQGQQKASWIKNLVDAPSPSEWRALKAEHEAELHRLQTRIAELEGQLEGQLEAIGAGGAEPLRCHDADACAMGQLPCPTPGACGCATPAISAKKMQPGDELHLSLLMAPHGLNLVVGQDRVQLLAYARDVWNAAQQAAAAPQAVQAAVPLPLLVRDIARDLGITVPEACSALKPLGNFSTNAAVTAEIARMLRDHFPGPAHPAGGVPAQAEALRAELEEATETADNWRRLALQFDNHRMQALWHLKVLTAGIDESAFSEFKDAKDFLAAPPLDGEAVLAQRIAALAAAQPAAQGMEKDAARWRAATRDLEINDIAVCFFDKHGDEKIVMGDEADAAIDAAIAAQAKQGEQA